MCFMFAPPRGERSANSKISALCECGRPPRGGTTAHIKYDRILLVKQVLVFF